MTTVADRSRLCPTVSLSQVHISTWAPRTDSRCPLPVASGRYLAKLAVVSIRHGAGIPVYVISGADGRTASTMPAATARITAPRPTITGPRRRHGGRARIVASGDRTGTVPGAPVLDSSDTEYVPPGRRSPCAVAWANARRPVRKLLVLSIRGVSDEC